MAVTRSPRPRSGSRLFWSSTYSSANDGRMITAASAEHDEHGAEGARRRRRLRHLERSRAGCRATARRPTPITTRADRADRAAAVRRDGGGPGAARAIPSRTDADRITSGSARDVSPSKTYAASARSTKIPTRRRARRRPRQPTARRRKYSTIARRSEPAGVPHEVHRREVRARRSTASTPPRIDVGLTQLDHGSPALPPAGTRPEAIAPATAPMQYGHEHRRRRRRRRRSCVGRGCGTPPCGTRSSTRAARCRARRG